MSKTIPFSVTTVTPDGKVVTGFDADQDQELSGEDEEAIALAMEQLGLKIRASQRLYKWNEGYLEEAKKRIGGRFTNAHCELE